MYQPVIEAVHNFNGVVLGTFAMGCAVGLLSFTHLLAWLLKHFHAATLAALTGFMLGSLNKVWPWKVPFQEAVDSNVWPSQYQAVTQIDPQLPGVLLLLCLGLLTVFLINLTNNAKSSG